MLHRILIAALCVACCSVSADAAPGWLVAAIIHVESGGNPNARGRHGEIGLGQLKLATARSVGYRGGRAGLFNPSVNRRYTEAYLNLAIRRAHGNLCHAASLYNAGVFARPRCSAYGRKVLRIGRR